MIKPKDILIKNGWFALVKGQKIQPVFGDMKISNGIIKEFRPTDFDNYIKTNRKKNNNFYDAGGRVITLPLVNFHEHFYSRLAKGLPIKGETDNFLDILHNLWWELDKALNLKTVRASAQMAVIESIKNGVTYVFDHHSSPKADRGSLNTIAEVLTENELRGVLCFETTDRNGVKFAKDGLKENLNFFENYFSKNLKSMVGLHASFTLSDDTLAEAEKIVRDNGLGIHIHLCEDSADKTLSKQITGNFPVKRLSKFNLLNVKSILAHGIYLTKSDYKIIDELGSAIAYNPDSNLNNSVGLPNFTLIPESIPVLMGTDGMHANPGRSLKNIFLLMRHNGFSFDDAFHKIQKIYFDQITFAKRYFPDYSSLQLGERADLIVWDYVPPTPFNENNFWGHYIYGILERPVQSTIQNGIFLMKDKKLTLIDEEKINKQIFFEGSRLFKKFINKN